MRTAKRARALAWVVVAANMVFFSTTASVGGAGDGVRAFSSLEEAVTFVAGRVEAGDAEGLAEECAGLGSTRDAQHVGFMISKLAKINERTPLVKLYAGREFPAGGYQLRLGGHDKELGHINIDFERVGNGWVLHSIYMCK